MNLFLRWILVNVLFVISLVIVALAYNGSLHVAAKLSITAILCVYIASSIYCGLMLWRYERAQYSEKHDNYLKRAAFNMHFAAGVCPMLGLLGTVSGFLIAFSAAGDEQQLEHLITGASTALASTFIGIISCLVLSLGRHFLLGRMIKL